MISSGPDHGYRSAPGRRKVLLWSRQPWTEVDVVGSPSLPSGRFVSGVAQGVRFVGVCVPWRDAHVQSGRRDRQPWEDHLNYLEAITPLLRRYLQSGPPVCLIGDFNQRIPRKRQPQDVFEALQSLLGLGLTPCTAGIPDERGDHLIDHVCLSTGFRVGSMQVVPREREGVKLSDHPGLWVNLLPEN